MNYWRYVWAGPPTMLGLAFATLALGRGRVRIVAGVIEAHGPWLRRLLSTGVPLSGGAAAITFGHVVLGQDQHALNSTRAHERVHVRQYERWGLLFLPAYAAASILAVLSGGHYYYDNAFERKAFAKQPRPLKRPLSAPSNSLARALATRAGGEPSTPSLVSTGQLSRPHLEE